MYSPCFRRGQRRYGCYSSKYALRDAAGFISGYLGGHSLGYFIGL